MLRRPTQVIFIDFYINSCSKINLMAAWLPNKDAGKRLAVEVVWLRYFALTKG